MGQGRNAIWLAEHGWSVTGFDISPVAVAQARGEAVKKKVRIEAVIAPYETFDWGKEKWDLIVLAYFLPQEIFPNVWESLRPGGMVLIETFHADTARMRPIGRGYTDKQMFEMLKAYRMLSYEDVEDKQEWGKQFGATNRLVRVLAQKPSVAVPGCSLQDKRYCAGETICFGAQWKCGLEGWERSGGCEAK